jgi:hypothetical protein
MTVDRRNHGLSASENSQGNLASAIPVIGDPHVIPVTGDTVECGRA